MSEVITRPVTKAQRTEAQSTVVAKVSPPTTSPDPIKVAFNIIQVLLDEASATVDQLGPRSDSDRLLQIAHNIADEAMVRTPTSEDAVSVAFDIAALIRAAKRVTADNFAKVLSGKYHAHLEAAYA